MVVGESEPDGRSRKYHILYRGNTRVTKTRNLATVADALFTEIEGLGFPERDDAIIPVDDTVDTTPPAEEAAVHVDESATELAADELAADADLDAEDPDVRAEAELEIEEESAITAGDDA